MKNEGIEIFSPEERSEITARIEKVSARNAVAAPGIPSKKEALRRGFFPLLINADAVVFLTAGIALLFYLQQTDAAEILKSGANMGVTERALIHEIRKEAHLQLNEKEAAIDAMNARIAEVEAGLGRLDSLEALTGEQRAAMEELRREREEYKSSLAELHMEKARILTNARILEAEARQREENLNKKPKEEQGVQENFSGHNRAEIESALAELSGISKEAEKNALVEKQLSGFYANISRQIEEGRYREAEGSIEALKEYLATPSFGSIKTIEARRESDIAAINVLSFLLAEAQKAGVPGASIQIETPPPVPPGDGAEEALRQQVTQQAASIAEQNAALASMEKTLAELQKSITDLQDRNDTFTQTIEEKDKQIEALQKTISNVSSALENQQ